MPRRPTERRTLRLLAELLGRAVDEVADGDGSPAHALLQRARAERARAIGDAVIRAARAVMAFARNAHARHRQRREARAVRDMLYALDDHMLRDLGLSRTEIASAAAEAAGIAEHTRRRVQPATCGPCS